MDERLNELVVAVLSSTKYRHVSPELVQSVGERELSIRPSVKSAVKATKNVLHQAGGAPRVRPLEASPGAYHRVDGQHAATRPLARRDGQAVGQRGAPRPGLGPIGRPTGRPMRDRRASSV